MHKKTLLENVSYRFAQNKLLGCLFNGQGVNSYPEEPNEQKKNKAIDKNSSRLLKPRNTIILIHKGKNMSKNNHEDIYTKRTSGTSKEGNLQEAIEEAITNATDSTGNIDTKIHWRLEEITGVNGTSIDDTNEITVSISFNVV